MHDGRGVGVIPSTPPAGTEQSTKSPSPKEVTDLGEAVLKGLALMNLLPE